MNKKALITGGNSGIGYATAGLFKERGYQVTISGRNSEKLSLAAAELGVEWVAADMARIEDLKMIATMFAENGLDVLVNNAGIAAFMPIDAHTELDYERFLNTNIRGPLALIQALLPALRKRRGCIINISSAISSNGLPNASLYAATKGAIDAFSRSLALELAPQNIRVNVVSPGAIDTPIISKLGLDENQIGAIKAHVESTIPMQRYGRPEEVAQVIFAQVEATYVTGAIWAVDGGIDAG
jgi:NAD(P)-dependent dehydrogenase (short-subunit alcohol dehydrogenase family)